MQRGSQSNDKQVSANENSFYAHRRNKMEPAFDEENRGEEMETDRGGAGGEGEAGVPYANYDVTVKMRSVGLIINEEEIADYAQSARVMQRTKRMLEADYHAVLGGGKELRLPNGTAAGIWTLARPDNEDAMPAGFDNDFTQISLDLVGAKSGAKLEGDWEKRVNCGKLLVEMTAAHAAFNRASGTSYEVIFEPDAARFGSKELRGVSIVASTAPTHVVARMLRLLKEMELDMPKFYRVLDERPLGSEQEPQGRSTHVRVGAGTWTTTWSDLDDLTYKVPAVIIGFDPAEYEDAMGSGVPLGVLRAELGDVCIAQTYNVRGYDTTRRVLLSCGMGEARDVIARLEDCTARDRQQQSGLSA